MDKMAKECRQYVMRGNSVTLTMLDKLEEFVVSYNKLRGEMSYLSGYLAGLDVRLTKIEKLMDKG